MLQFLAQRAVRQAGQAPAGDPWHGVGAVALRTMEEGPARSPSTWTHRWAGRVVVDFWRSQSHPLLQGAGLEVEMGALLKAQNAGRKNPAAWGAWPDPLPEVIMGATLSDRYPCARIPETVKVVGVEFSPADPEGPFRQALEGIRDEDREAWWIVPAKGGTWNLLNMEHYLLAHRMGVSLWLETPPQSGWANYLDGLAAATRQMCRDAHWEQWIWPVCDLLQKGFEESLNPLAPKASAPWRWEGRIRRPDWRDAQRVVWESAEEVLGGGGVFDELLVASALVEHGALKAGKDVHGAPGMAE